MVVPTTEAACPLHSSWKSRFARSGDVAVATTRSGEGRRQRRAPQHRHRGSHGDRRVAQVVEQLAGDDVRCAEVPDGALLRLRRAQAPLAVAGGRVLEVADDLQLQPGPEAAQALHAASELPRVVVSPSHPGPASSEGARTGARRVPAATHPIWPCLCGPPVTGALCALPAALGADPPSLGHLDTRSLTVPRP